MEGGKGKGVKMMSSFKLLDTFWVNFLPTKMTPSGCSSLPPLLCRRRPNGDFACTGMMSAAITTPENR